MSKKSTQGFSSSYRRQTDRHLVVDSPVRTKGNTYFSVGKAVCCNDDHMVCSLLFNNDFAVMEMTFRQCRRCADGSSLSDIPVTAVQNQLICSHPFDRAEWVCRLKIL